MNDTNETPLGTKYVNVDIDDVVEVAAAIESRSLSGTASVVEEYERELERTFDTSHAIAYSNGTTAIQGALLAAGVSRGDEVALAPTCPVMTVLPVLNVGATPVFVDTKEDRSFSIDPASLQERLTADTEAIISVPMWGYPTEIDPINEIAADADVTVIEDAAQAHGARIDDRYVGTSGDIGTFSTHHRKLICTGEGGFVLTDSDEIARDVAAVRGFGTSDVSRKEFDVPAYEFGEQFGMNYKFNAMGAAMGLSQIDKFESKLEQRRENAEYITEQLSRAGGPQEISMAAAHIPNYYSLVLEDPAGERSGRQIANDLADMNVISDTYAYDYCPLYELPLLERYEADCPTAAALTEQIFTVPTHEGLDREELDYIVESVLDAART